MVTEGGLESQVNIVISASHNVFNSSQEQADAELIEHAQEYRDRGLMPSYKFKRLRDNWEFLDGYQFMIDENKALLPIYGEYTSSLDIQVIRNVLAGAKISVVGSHEVKEHVNIIKDYLDQNYQGISQNIVFIPEEKECGDNIQKGWQALGGPHQYIFEPADTPLSSLEKKLEEFRAFKTSGDNHAMHIHLNSRKSMWKNVKEFFTRNYYGKVGGHEIKEPNLFFYTDEFQDWELVNNIYGKREGGGLAGLLVGSFKKVHKDRKLKLRMQIYGDVIKTVAETAYNFAKKRNFKLSTIKPSISLEVIEAIADKLTGVKTRFDISHGDMFRVKDIDSWHDWAYYRTLFDTLDQKYDGVYSIFSKKDADAIKGFDDFLVSKADEKYKNMPLTYHWKEFAEKRTRALQIKEYFTDGDFENGAFRITTRPDENIERSIKYLMGEHCLVAASHTVFAREEVPRIVAKSYSKELKKKSGVHHSRIDNTANHPYLSTRINKYKTPVEKSDLMVPIDNEGNWLPIATVAMINKLAHFGNVGVVGNETKKVLVDILNECVDDFGFRTVKFGEEHTEFSNKLWKRMKKYVKTNGGVGKNIQIGSEVLGHPDYFYQVPSDVAYATPDDNEGAKRYVDQKWNRKKLLHVFFNSLFNRENTNFPRSPLPIAMNPPEGDVGYKNYFKEPHMYIYSDQMANKYQHVIQAAFQGRKLFSADGAKNAVRALKYLPLTIMKGLTGKATGQTHGLHNFLIDIDSPEDHAWAIENRGDLTGHPQYELMQAVAQKMKGHKKLEGTMYENYNDNLKAYLDLLGIPQELVVEGKKYQRNMLFVNN